VEKCERFAHHANQKVAENLLKKRPIAYIPTSWYDLIMASTDLPTTQKKIIKAATDTFRRTGYVATTVDDICSAAGVSKGAFFHHYESKEALGVACLANWKLQMRELQESAPFQQIADPVEKVLAAVEFFADIFADPNMTKSCLAGTTVQEVSETHPALREAAQACFAGGADYFRRLLDDAARSRGINVDSHALAQWWMATLQGSLLLYKASRDETVIPNNLRLFRKQLEQLIRR
jgi:TetR/AcrR family transcriptional repressor of nem operon